tara:strand:+ start:391 stop:561 length:171 start_codon:yes stop_codon:yes gene_type:complete
MYLEECFQIEAAPGDYRIRYELVSPHLADITATNFRVEHGPAAVEHNVVRILDEAV